MIESQDTLKEEKVWTKNFKEYDFSRPIFIGSIWQKEKEKFLSQMSFRRISYLRIRRLILRILSRNKRNFDSTYCTHPGNEKEDHAIARKRRIVKNSSGRSRKLAGPKGIGHDGNQVSRLPAAWRGPHNLRFVLPHRCQRSTALW